MNMKQHKRARSRQDEPPRDWRWLLLAAAFLPGAAAGSLACARWEGLLTRIQAWNGQLRLWPQLWPELALLGALVLLGAVGKHGGTVLLVTAVKGFGLSARMTALCAGGGREALLAGACGQLMPEVLRLGAVFLLARQSLTLCVRRQELCPGRGRGMLPDGAFWLTAGVCALLLLGAAGMAAAWSPGIETWAQAILPQ